MPNELAPEGSVWVCLACGKRSQDKYGFKAITHGWDESCMMNCELFKESQLEISSTTGRVTKVKEEEEHG